MTHVKMGRAGAGGTGAALVAGEPSHALEVAGEIGGEALVS
ncbi:hypothetical protein [Actinomadura luzonensis]|nr:hypothetical protein [Actinomadura luzonensis]